MMLHVRGQGARAQISQQPWSTHGTVQVGGGEASFHLRRAALGVHPQVCIEGGAGVNEVELCPEGLLPVLQVRGRT